MEPVDTPDVGGGGEPEGGEEEDDAGDTAAPSDPGPRASPPPGPSAAAAPATAAPRKAAPEPEPETIPAPAWDPSHPLTRTQWVRLGKGIALMLGINALGLLAMFVPLVGPLLLVAVMPYFAAVYGARFLFGLPSTRVALLVGASWATVQTLLLFMFLGQVQLGEFRIGAAPLYEAALLGMIYIGNLLASYLGVRAGLPERVARAAYPGGSGAV